MKSIKTFVAVIALATSFGSFAAQTVTASASTLDGAEAKIAAVPCFSEQGQVSFFFLLLNFLLTPPKTVISSWINLIN